MMRESLHLYEKAIEYFKSEQLKKTPHPKHTQWASDIAHPCDLMQVMSRLRRKERRPPDPERIPIFELSEEMEKIAMRVLQNIGLKTVEYQNPEIEYGISGRSEGKFWLNDRLELFELKVASPFIWPKLTSPSALKNSDMIWVNNYYGQAQIYMLNESKKDAKYSYEWLYWIAINRNDWRWHEFWVGFDPEYAEELIQKSKRIDNYVMRSEYPKVEQCPDNLCPFSHICEYFPTRDFGPGTGIIIDAELEAMLERRVETKILHDEYEGLDEAIKAKFRGQEGTTECGRFTIKTTWTPEKVYSEAMVPKPRAGAWVVRIKEKADDKM